MLRKGQRRHIRSKTARGDGNMVSLSISTTTTAEQGARISIWVQGGNWQRSMNRVEAFLPGLFQETCKRCNMRHGRVRMFQMLCLTEGASSSNIAFRSYLALV